MKNMSLIGVLLGLFLISCNGKGKVSTQEEVSETNAPLGLQGRLVMGHEVRSFVACGDTVAYWVADQTNRLDSLYQQAAGDESAPYTEVYADLKVNALGQSTEGFSADYAGVYEVVEIVAVESMELHPDCK